jgi:LPXTG-motif cell wall-anchored protein
VNLLKSPLRRTTAVLAGAFLGMAGAVAIAAPASAHHPIVKPVSACQNADGTWQVKWKVTNSEWDLEGKIAQVVTQPAGTTVAGIEAGVTLPKSGHGAVVGVQQLPASATEARLAVLGTWVRDGQPIEAWNDGYKHKPRKKCQPTTPPTSTPPSSTPPSSTPPSSTPPSSTPPSSTPPSSTPPSSPSQTPTPSGSPSPEPGEPTPIFDADCTSITVGLDNPKDGVEFTLIFKTSKGETRTLVIAPGEKKSEKFSATTGFKIELTVKVGEFEETETITYEQPEDCDANGSGGGLPVTGAAAGSIAGGAGLLLAIGGGLFFLARRRKVKFTA